MTPSGAQAEPIPVAQRQQVGMIGTGLLGTAVGLRLIEAGYSLAIWNRNQTEPQTLLAAGAVWSANPFTSCQRVFCCLYNSDIVKQVVGTMISEVAADCIMIDMTTGEPDDADQLTELFEARSAHYLAAPVSGSSQQVRDGQAMLMVGGLPAAFSACQDLWSALSSKIHFTGCSSSASRMKLVTNLVLGLNRAALAEGLAFAQALGVDLQLALAVMQDSAAASAVMQVKGHKMIDRDFAVQARLNQHLKDVDIILDLAKHCLLELPLSETHQRLLQSAQTQGFGEADNSAIIEAYKVPRQ